MNETWSIKAIQDIILNDEKWEKKNMYATDSEKCLRGVYYSLIGEAPTTPITPRQKRKMEVGTMIELQQIKKLKSLGIFIGGQGRIGDEQYGVSGRPDALIISPVNCSDKVKDLIEQKKKIFQSIQEKEKEFYEANDDEDITKRDNAQRVKDTLYKRDKELTAEIIKEAEADPVNQVMLLEIKSIVLNGFEWRLKEGKPMDSHIKQVHLYMWKLKDKFKNLITRVVYVENAYQDIAEFDVQYDERIIEELKKVWIAIKTSVEKKDPPPCCPPIVRNPMNGRWQINFQADWCNYHIKCTGDPEWKKKAMAEVEKLNNEIPKRTYVRRKKPTEENNSTNQPVVQGHQP